MNVCTPSNHRCCRAGLHSHPVSRQAGAVTNLESDLALCLPPPQQLGSRAAEPCPVVAQAGSIAKWGSVSGLQAGDEKGVLKRRKKKKTGGGKDHKAYVYLTLLGAGHEPVALNSVTICLWGTWKEKTTAMSKFLCCETAQVLASPQVTQVSGPRVSAMIQACGPDWKIPCIYRQPLDTVVTSFEERLGRENSLPIQPLMLAPGVGASRTPPRACSQPAARRAARYGADRLPAARVAPQGLRGAGGVLGCRPRWAAECQLGWNRDEREGKGFAAEVEVSRVRRE